MPLNFPASLLTAAILCALSPIAITQSPSAKKPITLITWFGPGAIVIPNGPDWKLELINVYDKGTRPVFQLSNARTSVTASFILFENNSGQPNAQGCRKDAIDPIVESQGKLISERVDGESKDPAGNPLAMTSYMTAIGDTKGNSSTASLPSPATQRPALKSMSPLSQARPTKNPSGFKEASQSSIRSSVTNPTRRTTSLIATLLYKNSPALAAPLLQCVIGQPATGPKIPRHPSSHHH